MGRIDDGNSILRDEEASAIFLRVEADSLSFGNDDALTYDCAPDLSATSDSSAPHDDRSDNIGAGGYFGWRQWQKNQLASAGPGRPTTATAELRDISFAVNAAGMQFFDPDSGAAIWR